jgi:hypothetical protein
LNPIAPAATSTAGENNTPGGDIACAARCRDVPTDERARRQI